MRCGQTDCNQRLANFEKSLTGVGKKLGQVVQTTNSLTEFMKTLAYRSIDIEAHSMVTRLLF